MVTNDGPCHGGAVTTPMRVDEILVRRCSTESCNWESASKSFEVWALALANEGHVAVLRALTAGIAMEIDADDFTKAAGGSAGGTRAEAKARRVTKPVLGARVWKRLSVSGPHQRDASLYDLARDFAGSGGGANFRIPSDAIDCMGRHQRALISE
jgi:hypothetical protein